MRNTSRLKFISKPLLLIVLCGVIVSCKQKVKESHSPQLASDSFSENLASIGVTSSEFVEKLTYSQLGFQDKLVNNPYQFRDYRKDLNISAANIGIYLADAQYLKVYEQVELAYLSSKAGQRLFELVKSHKLDTSLSHMQEGFQAKDSAVFFLNDALKDTINGLSDVERKQYLISISFGTFIERNYILLNLLNAEVNFEEPQVAVLFAFLKKHNDQLASLLELNKDLFTDNYEGYLGADMVKYHSYYTNNLLLFQDESNAFRQKEFVASLLAKTGEMRNFIIYDGLLIIDDE